MDTKLKHIKLSQREVDEISSHASAAGLSFSECLRRILDAALFPAVSTGTDKERKFRRHDVCSGENPGGAAAKTGENHA
jgi:hypothetical protein